MKRSTPSGTQSPPGDRESSASSWPTPEAGDVLLYSYLWAREAAAGEESGRKDRPAVVVVAALTIQGRTRLLVAPVTHSPPEATADAIEVPANVKRLVSLDSARSWIVTTELNSFIWPGPDIRISPASRNPIIDAVPDWLFFKVRDAILQRSRAGQLDITSRTE